MCLVVSEVLLCNVASLEYIHVLLFVVSSLLRLLCMRV